MTKKPTKKRPGGKIPSVKRPVKSAPQVDKSLTAMAPVKMADIARLRGVSRQAVAAAVKVGGALHAAFDPQTKLVDAGHPDTVRWLGADDAPNTSTADFILPTDSSIVSIGNASDLLAIARDAESTFGSLGAYQAAAQVAKAGADARMARHKVDALEAKLISAELVRVHVFGALESLSLRLLSDAPKTLSLRVRAAASTPEAEAIARDTIGSHIRASKAQITRSLRSFRGDASPPELTDSSQHRSPDSSPLFPAGARTTISSALAAAAPEIFESASKIFSRHFAGRPFDDSAFDHARATLTAAEAELIDRIHHHLSAALDGAIRKFTATTEAPDAPAP